MPEDIYRQPAYDWYQCYHCGFRINIQPVREAADEAYQRDPAARAGTVIRCACGFVMAPAFPLGLDRIASHILYQRTWPQGMSHGPL